MLNTLLLFSLLLRMCWNVESDQTCCERGRNRKFIHNKNLPQSKATLPLSLKQLFHRPSMHCTQEPAVKLAQNHSTVIRKPSPPKLRKQFRNYTMSLGRLICIKEFPKVFSTCDWFEDLTHTQIAHLTQVSTIKRLEKCIEVI